MIMMTTTGGGQLQPDNYCHGFACHEISPDNAVVCVCGVFGGFHGHERAFMPHPDRME